MFWNRKFDTNTFDPIKIEERYLTREGKRKSVFELHKTAVISRYEPSSLLRACVGSIGVKQIRLSPTDMGVVVQGGWKEYNNMCDTQWEIRMSGLILNQIHNCVLYSIIT